MDDTIRQVMENPNLGDEFVMTVQLEDGVDVDDVVSPDGEVQSMDEFNSYTIIVPEEDVEEIVTDERVEASNAEGAVEFEE